MPNKRKKHVNIFVGIVCTLLASAFFIACGSSSTLKIVYTTKETDDSLTDEFVRPGRATNEDSNDTNSKTDDASTDKETENKTTSTTENTTDKATTTYTPTTQPTTSITQPTTTKPVIVEPITQTPTKPNVVTPSYTISFNNVSTGGSQMVSSDSLFTIDYSNINKGYVMVKHSANATNTTKVLIYNLDISPNYYQYVLKSGGDFQVVPITRGNGNYKIRVMYNVPNSTQYTPKCVLETKVTLINETSPYLYPNMGVEFTKSSDAVKKAYELTYDLNNAKDKTDAIYNWIINNVDYDWTTYSAIKTSVLTGHFPDVADTYKTRLGICSDYSVLMAAMCRSVNIPTRVVYGTVPGGYHAWNDVYYNGTWHRYDSTYGASNSIASSYTVDKYYF